MGENIACEESSPASSNKDQKDSLFRHFLLSYRKRILSSFATSVLKQTSSKWDEWVENTKQFLAHINPKISIGTDPMNDFSISFEYSMQDNAGNDILQLPEKIAIEKGFK